jgi:hypothetical protein
MVKVIVNMPHIHICNLLELSRFGMSTRILKSFYMVLGAQNKPHPTKPKA